MQTRPLEFLLPERETITLKSDGADIALLVKNTPGVCDHIGMPRRVSIGPVAYKLVCPSCESCCNGMQAEDAVSDLLGEISRSGGLEARGYPRSLGHQVFPLLD